MVHVETDMDRVVLSQGPESLSIVNVHVMTELYCIRVVTSKFGDCYLIKPFYSWMPTSHSELLDNKRLTLLPELNMRKYLLLWLLCLACCPGNASDSNMTSYHGDTAWEVIATSMFYSQILCFCQQN